MMTKDYEPAVKSLEVNPNATEFIIVSFDIIPSLFLQDMLKVGMERRLHIPPGSAYTKMFPDPRSGDCKYQTCVWADTLTYNATVACDPFYKH